MVHEARKPRFSWITDGVCPADSSAWDFEIVGTPNFVVTPSMGSLVAGWLLAVPRKSLINLGMLNDHDRDELTALINRVAESLSAFGGEVFCFEHGADHSGSLTGCGVDQAHLHMVPLGFDLVSAVQDAADEQIKWEPFVRSANPLTLLPKKGEYVAIWRASDGRGLIGAVRHPVSQWVRRVIAQNLGIEGEWNYQTHPQRQIVNQTLAMLSATTSAPALT